MNDTKNSINTENNDDESIFFTTSDLLKTINNVIKETGNDELNPQNCNNHNGPVNSSSSTSEGFELQKRMPDGSTRKADESDIALADFQSKMKQVREEIYQLLQRLVSFQ